MANLAGPLAVPIRILRVARQSGRAASAGGHLGGPRRATRSSHSDSPGRLVNSKNNSVERNGGSFQRRLELEDRRSALNPLYHATRKPRARLFMLMHVCARATSKIRASLTIAPIVASDLFSNRLSFISKVARQSGRAASAGGHHGGPRRATRRSHPDGAAAEQQQTDSSGTTADGSNNSEAGGGAVEAQARIPRKDFSAAAEQ